MAALLHERDQLREDFPLALVEVTLDGRVTHLSRRARDLLGFTNEDVAKGLTVAGIVEKEAAAFAEASIARDLAALASGARSESRLVEGVIPFRFRRGDGSEGFAEGQAGYFSDASGGIAGVRLVLRDATERMRVEEELRRNRAEFERIFESATEGIWECDAAGETARANPAMARMLGYTPAEMLGVHLSAFMFPEDRADAATRFDMVSQGRREPRFDTRLCARDGREVWVRVATNPLYDGEGQFGGFLGLVTDITEAKRTATALVDSERRFRSLFANMQAGVLIRDAEGVLLDMNPAAEQILGVSREEMIGTALMNSNWEAVAEDGQPMPEEQVPSLKAIRTGQAVHNAVMGLRNTATGQVLWSMNSAQPEFDREGNVTGVVLSFVDIGERKAVEDALRLSETRHRSLLSNLRLGVMVLDSAGYILMVNPAASDILRIWEPEPVGVHASVLNPHWLNEQGETFEPGTGPISRAVFTKSAVRGVVLGYNTPVEQERRWMELDVEPEFDAQGEVVQVTCTIVDITDRKVATDALGASERRYRTLLESLRVGVMVLSPDLQIRLMNSAASEILKTPSERVVGRPTMEFARSWFDLSGKHYKPGHGPIRAAVMAKKPARNLVMGFHSGVDGSDSWLEMDVDPELDERGDVRQVVCTIVDITERKLAQDALRASETRFRSLVEGLRVGILVTDPQGTILMLNRAATEILNAPAQALIGRNGNQFRERWHDEQGKPFSVEDFAMSRLLREKRPVRGAILGYSDERTGQRTWVMVDGDVEWNDAGEVRQALYSLTDVTARIESEQERRTMERQLFEAQKFESLGVLAGGVAHDFNNLLTGVLANAEFALLDLPADSPARESIKEITHAAQRAADLARQMLTYSGRGQVSSTATDLNDVVREIRLLLRSSTSRKIDLLLRLEADLPLVHADATQVRQVLMNLVTNASDAIADQPGLIEISTGVMEATRDYLDETYLAPALAEGTYAYFEVQDNGPGMDEATVQRVFEPFFTTKFTGRGLGMSSAVGLIRAGLGAVHLVSKPGKGTTFRVLLPLANAPAAAESKSPVRSDGILGPGIVLVAEDEATVRRVVTRSLENFGLTPLLAVDGHEAVERFIEHQERIDCVLLDLTMPRMSGQEALAAIRELRPGIPVVLMSGFTSDDIGMDLQESGALFLQKPFEVDELRVMLGQVLRKV